MCALYLESKDYTNNIKPTFSYAFIDGCAASKQLNSKFLFYESSEQNAFDTGYYPELNCSQTIKNESDEDAWSKIEIYSNFKCARVSNEDSCSIYLVCLNSFVFIFLFEIKSVKFLQFLLNKKLLKIEIIIGQQRIKLRVKIKCKDQNGYLSEVYIMEPKNSNNNLGGLCGRLSCKECSLVGENNKCLENHAELTNYWR